MNKETIEVTNQSGSHVRLTFDPANVVEDAGAIVLRVPASMGASEFVVLVAADKRTYPSREAFLSKVESAGKPALARWLEGSADRLILPRQDSGSGLVIAIEEAQ